MTHMQKPIDTYTQPPLFELEDVLSAKGLKQAWMDALALSRHPADVPYGCLTAEHVISNALRTYNLRPVVDTDPLEPDIQTRAEEYASYERSRFERGTSDY